MADSLLQQIIENMTNGGICKHFERMCGSGIWGCAILKSFPDHLTFFILWATVASGCRQDGGPPWRWEQDELSHVCQFHSYL